MPVTFTNAGAGECPICLSEAVALRGHSSVNSRGEALAALVHQACAACLAQLASCPFCRAPIEGAARPIIVVVGQAVGGRVEDLATRAEELRGPRRHAISLRRQEFY